jgi:hypothetical protein
MQPSLDRTQAERDIEHRAARARGVEAVERILHRPNSRLTHGTIVATIIKVNEGHHPLSTMISKPKMFPVGKEDELHRLAR